MDNIKPKKKIVRKKHCELIGDIVGLIEYGQIKVYGDIIITGNNNVITSESTADPLNILIIEGDMKIRGSNMVISGITECQGKVHNYGKLNTIRI